MCSIHVGPPHQRWVQNMLGHPIEDGFNTCWATPPRMGSTRVGPLHWRWVPYMLGHPIEDGFNTCWATPLKMGSIHVGPPHWRWVQYMSGHSIEDGVITIQAAYYNQYKPGYSIYNRFYYWPAIPSKMGLDKRSATRSVMGRRPAWLAHVTWGFVNLAGRSKMGVIHWKVCLRLVTSPPFSMTFGSPRTHVVKPWDSYFTYRETADL
jgi:hypothetical protein